MDPLEGKEEEVVTIENTQQLIQEFRNSNLYKEGFQTFFKGKKLHPDVSQNEMQQTFESQDMTRITFIIFATKELRFHYNPNLYPIRAQKAIKEYVGTVSDIVKMEKQNLTPEEILSLDHTRRALHSNAAMVLKEENLVPSESLGKGLASLVVLEKGYDTYHNVIQPTAQRIARVIGGNH